MKKFAICLLLLSGFIFKGNAQSQTASDAQLKSIANIFVDCIVKKDSIKFYSLFNENPITFVREYKPNLSEGKNTVKSDYYNDDYKKFFRYIAGLGLTKCEMSNLVIQTDDYTASVVFDYHFLKGRKNKVWGNESFGLIFKNRNWLITRVVYTLNLESENPESKKGN